MPISTAYYGYSLQRLRCADPSLRVILGFSVLAHLVLAALLFLLPGRPAGQGEMNVELATLLPAEAVAAPAALPDHQAMPALTAPSQLLPYRHPEDQVSPYQAAPQAATIHDESGNQRGPAAPASSSAPRYLPGSGWPSSRSFAPVPFPDQQKRITSPFSNYSTSHHAAA